MGKIGLSELEMLLNLRKHNIDIIVHDGEQEFFEQFSLMFFDRIHSCLVRQFEDFQLGVSEHEAKRKENAQTWSQKL